MSKDLVIGSTGHIYQEDTIPLKDQVIAKGGKQYNFITNASSTSVSDLGNGDLQYKFDLGGRIVEHVYHDAIVGPPRPQFKGMVGVYQSQKPQS
jgi:hypothetical protein